MVSQTKELNLEDCICRALSGKCQPADVIPDTVGEGEQSPYGPKQDYELGLSADFDKEFAVDTEKFWRFLETTQPTEVAKLRDRPNWQRLVLERLHRKIAKDGILQVLKRGISIDDASFTLLYSLPYNDANNELWARFGTNLFSITRQLYYSPSSPRLSIDLVLFINGLPIATMELKNAWTGQTVVHAKKQYKLDRDPKDTLLSFARCLVHFAVDTDEVYMTTKLDGENTFFLPFNRGNNHGKGNPVNPLGHRSAYLWESVLTKKNLTNIIEHFGKLVEERDPKTRKIKKTLFFPRYHQLDVVQSLLADAGERGPGQKYLIQHSAGSGKSNSITWLAYQLIELYAEDAYRPVFDSVIVVTDRRLLDKQLRDNIKQFSEVKNIVAHAENSQGLKMALESGKKLIITTIQKFPFIVDGIAAMSERNFAVIIDEAHSSQSGKAADNLSKTLGNAEEEEEPEDLQEFILQEMDKRRLSANASYFAFTATPKNATLEKFGKPLPTGEYKPFHLYSMKQAIEEEFILDVLSNYTTYRSYYQIQKSIEDNPRFDTKKAQKKLKAYVESHKETVAQKADVMVSHFIEQVWKPKKLKGQAKAMVVTQNITIAIRYFMAIREALKEQHTPFKAIIAFSGKKTVDGIEYTEELINGFPSKDIPEQFDSEDYKILVVANKFLTGFDQPKLHTMYVDKRLQHVLAVQTLSRLNRSNKKLGKNDTFVLDFFNSTQDIKEAFDPFYTATTLSAATNVNVLHDVKDALDQVGVYDWHEVVKFNELFFNNAEMDALSPIIDVAAARFNDELELEDDEKVDFKIKAKQFVKVYGQVACILPFNIIEWEMLHWFLKFLISKLKVKEPGKEELDKLLESIDLSTYGIERTQLKPAKIELDDSDSKLDPQNPAPRGAHTGEEERNLLDEIVSNFNERFFAGWEGTPEEQRVKFVNIIKNVVNNPNYEKQVVNNDDTQNSNLALQKIIQSAIQKQRNNDMELYKKYSSDQEFKEAYNSEIMRYLKTLSPEDLEKLLKAS